MIPSAVDFEIRQLSKFSIALDEYQNSYWIRIGKPSDVNRVNELREEIDEGESEAIALAEELGAEYLLIDERLGTNKARENGLKTIGLLGVLVKAKEMTLIEKVEPIVKSLTDVAGFWVSKQLMERLLKQVNER